MIRQLLTVSICAAALAGLPALAQTTDGTPPAATSAGQDDSQQGIDPIAIPQSHRTGAQATTTYSGSSTDAQPAIPGSNSDYTAPTGSGNLRTDPETGAPTTRRGGGGD